MSTVHRIDASDLNTTTCCGKRVVMLPVTALLTQRDENVTCPLVNTQGNLHLALANLMKVASSSTNDQMLSWLRVRLERAVDFEHEYELVRDAVIECFNPRDDDSGEADIMVDAVKAAQAFIVAQNCTCTAERVADHDPCPRCLALGRLGDKRVDR